VLWHCWLSDRKGIRPVKLGVGLLVMTVYLIAPVVTTTSITLSSNKIQNGYILVAANPGPPGKWPFKWRESPVNDFRLHSLSIKIFFPTKNSMIFFSSLPCSNWLFTCCMSCLMPNRQFHCKQTVSLQTDSSLDTFSSTYLLVCVSVEQTSVIFRTLKLFSSSQCFCADFNLEGWF